VLKLLDVCDLPPELDEARASVSGSLDPRFESALDDFVCLKGFLSEIVAVGVESEITLGWVPFREELALELLTSDPCLELILLCLIC
jgi:hypothetical protein